MNPYLILLANQAGPVGIIIGLSIDIATILFWRRRQAPLWTKIGSLLAGFMFIFGGVLFMYTRLIAIKP